MSCPLWKTLRNVLLSRLYILAQTTFFSQCMIYWNPFNSLKMFFKLWHGYQEKIKNLIKTPLPIDQIIDPIDKRFIFF